MLRIFKVMFVSLGVMGTLVAPFAAFLSPQPLEIAPLVPDIWIGSLLLSALVLSASATAWCLGIAFLPTSLFLGLAFIRIAFSSGGSAALSSGELASLYGGAGILLAASALAGALAVRSFRQARGAA